MKKIQNSRFKIQNTLFTFCILNFVFFSLSCSIPILEPAECIEAKQSVKEFYSLHFGGEMRFSPEDVRRVEKYLTPEYIAALPKTPTDSDVFTVNSKDYPKAFRIGGCRVESPNKTVFEVLLFWKTDERDEQREINVEIVKQNEQWRINKIMN